MFDFLCEKKRSSLYKNGIKKSCMNQIGNSELSEREIVMIFSLLGKEKGKGKTRAKIN
jgi:hypothetical protein